MLLVATGVINERIELNVEAPLLPKWVYKPLGEVKKNITRILSHLTYFCCVMAFELGILSVRFVL